jgi:sensor c-di-GMP phosphodiesterase-like protein
LVLLWLMLRLEESRSSLPALFRNGLRRNEVLLVYQPIVDMRTGSWMGAEVLSRWRRRSGEWVSPDVFIPIAEKHGLITQLTQFVVRRTLTEMGGFVQARPNFFLSINISSLDLGSPGFVSFLTACCAEHGVARGAVHLEITERQPVDDAAEADVIAILRTHGFKLGTDDFGVGYSNLAYLENFQLDYLKIDRVFVANAFRGTAGVEMIDHIIGVGNAHGLEIIAEGIEHLEQQTQLLARGVQLGQGWLFAKAMPSLEFVRTFRAPPAV